VLSKTLPCTILADFDIFLIIKFIVFEDPVLPYLAFFRPSEIHSVFFQTEEWNKLKLEGLTVDLLQHLMTTCAKLPEEAQLLGKEPDSTSMQFYTPENQHGS